MSATATSPDQPDAATANNDPTGVERQRAKLDRLGDLALELTEILVTRAREAADDVDLDGIALAVARVSRVVRLTCALHLRLAQTAQAIETEQDAMDRGRAYADMGARTDHVVARKRIILRALARVASRDEGLEEHEALEVVRDCRERLDDDTLINLLDRPVSEIIAEFCRSLGLTPDWEAVAAEAWAVKEIEGGDVGAPLAAIAARMIDPPAARRPVPRGPSPRARPRAANATAVRAASP